MKELVLYARGKSPDQPGQADEGRLHVHWGERDVPAGHYSLPALVDRQLLTIRGEHMQWAYDLGEMPVHGDTLANVFTGGIGPSMWWTSLIYERHPKLSPNLYSIYRLRCLELLLAESGCQGVKLVGGDKTLFKTLGRLCQALGLTLSQEGKGGEKGASPGLTARIYSFFCAPIRAMIRLGHWWWAIRRKLPKMTRQRDVANWQKAYSGSGRPATIVTYFPNIDLRAAARGRFHSRYWEDLHRVLNARAKYENPDGGHFVRWLFIRFPAPGLDFDECVRLRDLFQKDGRDGLSYNYLEEFLASRDIWRALGRWLRLCAASLRVGKHVRDACHFKNSHLNFWEYIRGQWAESFRGWRCLERCLQNLAFRRYSEKAGRQRWTLFPLENCPWERMLTEACRALPDNGPVFGVQHSIVRPTDFRYFDDPRTFAAPDCALFQPDVIGGNGKSAIGQWLGAGMPKERVREMAALRYLYLAELNQNSGGASSLPPEPGEPLEKPGAKRMLVLTSFFKDETSAHLDLLARSLAAGLFAGWRIIIKPHPYLAVDKWLADQPREYQEMIEIVDGPIKQQLKPGVCVWAANSTTASLEAALMGLPLLVMLPRDDFDLCPIQNVPGLVRTGTLADVKAGLADLKPLRLEPDYLDLDTSLKSWRELLGLNYAG